MTTLRWIAFGVLVAWLWPKAHRLQRPRASAGPAVESPNEAENLAHTHEHGALAGIATQDQLFPGAGGDAQAEGIRPGLPDFFRGA